MLKKATYRVTFSTMATPRTLPLPSAIGFSYNVAVSLRYEVSHTFSQVSIR